MYFFLSSLISQNFLRLQEKCQNFLRQLKIRRIYCHHNYYHQDTR